MIRSSVNFTSNITLQGPGSVQIFWEWKNWWNKWTYHLYLFFEAFAKHNCTPISLLPDEEVHVRTAINPPPDTFHSTIETIREVWISSLVGVQVSPNIDKFTSTTIARRRGVEEILESCGFCLCITRRLIPIGFGICQVQFCWSYIEVTCPYNGLLFVKQVEVSKKVLVP